jgi:hypothetical protein
VVGFCAKALACANAGGVAAIITNNVAGPLSGAIEPCATTLPTFGFEQSAAALFVGVSVTGLVGPPKSPYAFYQG